MGPGYLHPQEKTTSTAVLLMRSGLGPGWILSLVDAQDQVVPIQLQLF